MRLVRFASAYSYYYFIEAPDAAAPAVFSWRASFRAKILFLI